jgi:hypothetical protein
MDSEQVRQLVEDRLREAQQNKVYKDYGRISGTAKERKALGFITVTITEEQERSLDELADLVKKDKILPKFDPEQERANGNTAGAAYFRYQVLRNWIPKPTVKAREVFTLYVQALTQWNEVTGKNTTLQTAREAFVALFQCHSWERDKNGIIANQAAAIKSLEGKDWSRYTEVNPDYKYKEDMKAAMLAIVGKQVVKQVGHNGGEWYFEAKEFEALSIEEAEALQEKYLPRLQSNVDVWTEGIDAIANASTLQELAAATKSDLMAKKYGKIEWREEVLKRVRANTWTLENGRQQLVDYWKRQAGHNLATLQDAMKKYSPRDEDWSWTAKYFGRTVERKAPAAGGITVNSYPNLEHLERRNGLAVAKKLSTTELAENWGLKAVQYGNSLSDGESARLTYWANASFMDLAEMLQVNIQQLNKLLGLGLDLATRGRKGSVATYWPTYTVINLNRYGGDGSLAHEWAHAMDHWLGRRRNAEGYLSESTASITEGARASEKAVRDIMRFTFGHGYQDSITVQASDRIRYRLPAIDMDKTPAQFHAWLMAQWSRHTEGNRRTQEELAADVAKAYGVESITVQVDSQGSDQYQGSKSMNKPYWVKPVELFARSFEGYVIHRMQELDLQSDYLQEPRKWAFKFGVYPSERDMEQLAPLFNAFFIALAAEEGLQLRMDELPIVRPAGEAFTNLPRESHKEAVPAPKGKADETGEELVEEQESEAQGEAPAPEAQPQVEQVVAPPPAADPEPEPTPEPVTPEPTPAPKQEKRPKLSKFGQQVQAVCDQLNTILDDRLQGRDSEKMEELYRFGLGPMFKGGPQLERVPRNVGSELADPTEAEPIMVFGPYTIYLQNHFNRITTYITQVNTFKRTESIRWERNPKLWTMSSFGTTWGIENITEPRPNTRAKAVEAFGIKIGNVLKGSTGPVGLAELLESAKEKLARFNQELAAEMDAQVAVDLSKREQRGKGYKVKPTVNTDDVKGSLERMAEKKANPLPYAKLVAREGELQEKLADGTATLEELQELVELVHQLKEEGAYRSEAKEVYVQGSGADKPEFTTVQPEQTEEQRYQAELAKVREAIKAKQPAHKYELGDGDRDNFDHEGMLAWYEKAKAGQLTKEQLEQLRESLRDLKYDKEEHQVWEMLAEMEFKLSPEQQQDVENDDLITYLFTGESTSSMIVPSGNPLPVVGQRVIMGLDAVDVRPDRIILARPGATIGVAVFNELVKVDPYPTQDTQGKDLPDWWHLIRTASWEKGFFADGWEVQERTSWPTLRLAVAGVYPVVPAQLDAFAQELEEVAALPVAEIKARKRPEGKPPSPKDWRQVKKKLRGIARQAKGEDQASVLEAAQRIQALRGYYGLVDQAARNKRTVPLNKKNLQSWAKAPGRMDLEGIDTPR